MLCIKIYVCVYQNSRYLKYICTPICRDGWGYANVGMGTRMHVCPEFRDPPPFPFVRLRGKDAADGWSAMVSSWYNHTTTLQLPIPPTADGVTPPQWEGCVSDFRAPKSFANNVGFRTPCTGPFMGVPTHAPAT